MYTKHQNGTSEFMQTMMLTSSEYDQEFLDFSKTPPP